MKKMYLLNPSKPSEQLKNMIKAAVSDYNAIEIKETANLPDLRESKLIFAVQLNNAGYCPKMDELIYYLWQQGPHALDSSEGCVLIHCESELFTKTYAQNLVLHANMLGCRFMGRPVVEAAANLANLLTAQKKIQKPLEEVLEILSLDLIRRLSADNPKLIENPKLTVLHAGNHRTSNTLMLWEMVKRHLPPSIDISTIHVENGTVKDCIGCSYRTCKHFAENSRCFYGGIMVEEIYPAVLQSDAIVWICPNYNDALSANLSAVINRLTALFRKNKFYDKSFFSIIVSGNSGSDAVAKQLISALNMNKTFRLPPFFALTAVANDKGTILNVPGIEEKARHFAENIKNNIKK